MSNTRIAPEQSEVLQRVIEAAPQVLRRHQFFGWSQGGFQRWLPHQLSICGSYDRDQRHLMFDVFNSVPVPEDVLHGLKDVRSELLQRAMLAWRRARCKASRLTLGPDVMAHGSLAALGMLGYTDVVMHGIHRPGRPEEIESFFVFTQHNASYDEADLQALEMLLPCLHVVYQRVSTTERQMVTGRSSLAAGQGGAPVRAIPITEREREILLWVRDGLSNHQISEKLGISALTVKNHVQKILRKLGAANRAQAVAKAMTMNALGASPHVFSDFY
ncbi:MAG: LuxR C-terminal-related transcriptional regulator [Aquabacterium sp.]